MARQRLSAKGVDAIRTDQRQEDFWDDLTPGLCLRVSGSTGRKTWLVRYRANGKHRRMKLGVYPAMSLASARQRARSLILKAHEGEDPILEKRAARSDDRTFEAMAREVLDAKAATTRDSTQAERERILAADLLPEWEGRPAGSITRREVVQLVERVSRRAPIAGNRSLALIRMLFNEGLAREFPGLEYNPAHRVRPPRPEKGRARYLERDELRSVWEEAGKELPVTRGIFRVALLTAQRIGNVAAMEWSEVDESNVWRIPEEKFKGGRPHLVPLSSEVMDVLEELRGVDTRFVFPGRADGVKGHVVTPQPALKRIRDRTKIPHWVAHDFRTTFRTWATRAAKPKHPDDPAGLGVAPNIADAVLGHVEASLGFRRYQGAQEQYLLAEKREALEAWGAFVRAAVEADATRT